jgi:hypothetical protein
MHMRGARHPSGDPRRDTDPADGPGAGPDRALHGSPGGGPDAAPHARLDPGAGPEQGSCAEPLRCIDWTAAGLEAAEVLSGYLRIDTSNPPGNETAGARYLAALLEREEIPSEILEIEPGRGSLVARVPGDGAEPPVGLLSHIDVATASADDWVPGRAPFSGLIDEDGVVWGRGALDMKGMGVLELLTLVWAKRLGIPLRRDLVLLAVADEEVERIARMTCVSEPERHGRCSRWGQRRRSRGQAEVSQDAGYDLGVGEECDDLARSAAACGVGMRPAAQPPRCCRTGW